MGLVDKFPLYIFLDDRQKVIQRITNESLERARKKYSESEIQEASERILNATHEFEKRISEIVDNTDRYKEFLGKLEDNKHRNSDYLQKLIVTETSSAQNFKPEKKLTLNSAFVKVFREVLEPLGFRKHKTESAFVRMLNEEIIQVVTVCKLSDPIGEYSTPRFNVYYSVMPIYSENIICKITENNTGLFTSIDESYVRNYDLFGRDMSVYSELEAFEFDSSEGIISMENAFEEFKKYCLPPLERADTLRNLLYYNDDFNRNIKWKKLYLLCDDYIQLLHDKEDFFKRMVDYDIEHGLSKRTMDKKEEYYSKIEQAVQSYFDYLNVICNNQEEKEAVLSKYNETKEENLKEINSII